MPKLLRKKACPVIKENKDWDFTGVSSEKLARQFDFEESYPKNATKSLEEKDKIYSQHRLIFVLLESQISRPLERMMDLSSPPPAHFIVSAIVSLLNIQRDCLSSV